MRLTRRRFLGAGVGAGAALLAGCSRESDLAYTPPEEMMRDRGLVTATPSCEAQPRDATARLIEGPFYLAQTPERGSLIERGVEGERLWLVGTVMTRRCEPVAGAVLDFWQADPEGRYDREGMLFRGHQFTDAAGAYQLRTLKPGSYRDGNLERTPHLHVKVQGAGTQLLTTQLYFPDERERNEADPLFDARTLMDVQAAHGGGLFGRFDFVLEGAG